MNFAAPKNIPNGVNSYAVSHGDDSGIIAEFEKQAIYNEHQSTVQGRAVYDDLDFIIMHFPGDKTKVVSRRVKTLGDNQGPADPERFPRQWVQFQAQQEQVQDGTPISQWPPLKKSEVLELKAMHIHTVESLASLPDTALTWLGSRELREKAKAWLDSAKGGAETTRLLAENEALRNDVDVLKRNFADLVAKKSETSDETEAKPPRSARTATSKT